MPDRAEGERRSDAMFSDVVLACLKSTGDSGRTGDSIDRTLERDWSVLSETLTTLPFLLCPCPETLPLRSRDFVLLGLVGIFQVMLDGVEGREVEDIGWNVEPARGERGRRRPNTGESMGSGEEEELLLRRRSSGVKLPLRGRSSGVKRPFGVRLKKSGDGETGVVAVGDVGRDVRDVDVLELVRYIEEKLCTSEGGG